MRNLRFIAVVFLVYFVGQKMIQKLVYGMFHPTPFLEVTGVTRERKSVLALTYWRTFF
jgi:hypothetical protein